MTHLNDYAVRGLIERAAKITGAEAEELAVAWSAAQEEVAGDVDAWYDAWYVTSQDAARDAARSTERYDAWDYARAALDAALDASWTAKSAAWDAALAVLVRDRITPEDYMTLVGPWESVMGPIFQEDDQ